MLQRLGYKNLVNLTGGMDEWKRAGLPRVDGEGAFC